MSALNLTEHLGALNTPTLMIAGSGDGLLTANLQDFQRLPNADLAVLSRVGHEVAVHAPDAVAEAIDKFMTYGPTAPKTAPGVTETPAGPRSRPSGWGARFYPG